jgi:hypothetical protein
MDFKQTENCAQNISILNPNRWYVINILPLVEGVSVDYHKKKKYHPRRRRG